ncbi:Transposase IS116/IS110/IS902 family protein [Haloechinothrix alba]|uniref:Transposase IS116/IS110/IS902 family protein n=1 Tax=Haloechinothrix alba TaxID=664784 RepID=A0A239AHP7_9PSEU|nr:Transposase IS116/IS110/IS902 family protein [Haloechinothrix alba]
MIIRMGIDIAIRAPHQASLADEQGRVLWSGHRFRTSSEDLDRLWSRLPDDVMPDQVTIVMEPTRNAWVPLAAWFRRRGATVVLVSAERSADLRAYYAKHTKSDRLDSILLARLPLLHPDGLHPEHGIGPGDPLRRATKLHSTLVKRRTTSLARLDALLELLGPDWHAALGGDLANKTPLRFLAAGYADPHTLRRLGRCRLARFFYRHSRGAWGEPEADKILAAARTTADLWGDELAFAELAEDIAVEARLALAITDEIKDVDERIAVLVAERDPDGIITSAPGVGAVTGAVILGRLGDPSRFSSLAAVRSFSGLVPSLDASGLSGSHGGPTKRGDALLREALFMAASQARRHDPTLAAKYHRLMVETGKHHNSALCHIASILLTRIASCWKNQSHYQLRDVDGALVDRDKARAIIAERYTVPEQIRRSRATVAGTSQRSKESQAAPSTGPSTTHARRRRAARHSLGTQRFLLPLPHLARHACRPAHRPHADPGLPATNQRESL